MNNTTFGDVAVRMILVIFGFALVAALILGFRYARSYAEPHGMIMKPQHTSQYDGGRVLTPEDVQ